ncbi:MAG: hypothetical protein PHW60_03615 [Kiritimatiellae bacterium]|nr:hypothetical protein [Kiritimatiellia bacterium]
MEGIVTFTVEIASLDDGVITCLSDEVSTLGLKATLPQTEGSEMALPAGTYGAVIQLGDQMAQLKHYYRSLVAVMRKLKIKGTYFVNVSQEPAFVCGRL